MNEITIAFNERSSCILEGLVASSGKKKEAVVRDALTVTAEYYEITSQGYALRAVPEQPLFSNSNRIFLDKIVSKYLPYSRARDARAKRYPINLSEESYDLADYIKAQIDVLTWREIIKHSLAVLEVLAHLKSQHMSFQYVTPEKIRASLFVITDFPIPKKQVISSGQGIIFA